MRRPNRTFVAVAVVALLGCLPASAAARPLEATWRNTLAHPSDRQVIVVDPATGDLFAMTAPFYENQTVRRFDAQTGAVEWTTAVSGALSFLAVDRSTGRVVLAGEATGGTRLTVLDERGAVVWDALTRTKASVTALAVDSTSGQICTFGALGRSNTEKAWLTSCWSANGTSIFSHAWSPPDGPSQPNALVVDPRSHRVYVAGTSRPYGKHTGRRQDVVLLAYDPTGHLMWSTRSKGAVFPSYFDVALDSEHGRIHLLGDPAVIDSPTRLFSFDTAGRKRFAAGWQDPESTYAGELAVTPAGRVLAVSASGRMATLRSYARSGRLLSSEQVQIADRGRDGGLPKVAIDPRRGRAHILNDMNSPDYIARIYSFTFTGRRLSRPIVDKGKFMTSAALAVHPTSGRVFAATTLWPRGRHRITALSD